MTTRIGVVGGGQLGRMMAIAGARLNMSFVFLDPSEECCAAAFGEHIRAEYDDQDALAELASRVDLVTFEFENVPDSAVEMLSRSLPVFPRANALQLSRDRLSEKTMLNHLGIETAPFVDVLSQEALAEAIRVVGIPSILKTRTLGYDGKGQKVIRSNDDVAGSFGHAGSVPCVLEGFVPFKRELSIISVRSANGQISHYPLTTNVHVNGVLDTSVPGIVPELQEEAEAIASKIIDHLDYVGVLAVEFFDVGGRLVVNEIAPRVHNSGHWTIEGAFCSQFENHLRAITALPLGDTGLVADCAMVNFIGQVPDMALLSAIPGCSIHHYGKMPRKGRKVGHATILARSPALLDLEVKRVVSAKLEPAVIQV